MTKRRRAIAATHAKLYGSICQRELKPSNMLEELPCQVPYRNGRHISSRYDWVQGVPDRAKERLLL